MTLSSLTRLSDTALTLALESSVRDEKRATAVTVAHLAEFDARKLYGPAGYPSMHAYAMGRLHLSRDAAFRRIRAARKARQFRSILPMLADGRLHLTAIVLLSYYLTRSNAEELLAAAVHKSRQEIELMLAHRFPKPDVPTRLRPISTGRPDQAALALVATGSSGTDASRDGDLRLLVAPAPVEPGSQVAPAPVESGDPGSQVAPAPVESGDPGSQVAPAPVESPVSERASNLTGQPASMPAWPSPVSNEPPVQVVPAPVGAPDADPHRALPEPRPQARPVKLKPLAPERFALQVTIGQGTHDKLRRAQVLLGHEFALGDLAGVLDRALGALIERLEKRKLAATPKPRPSAGSSRNPRYVPAQVKRAVSQRDGDRCTFVSADGHRCEARTDLEWDHVQPVARGGMSTVENIRQRCRLHNQHAAECIYGAEFMAAKREASRSMNRASTGALH